MVYSTNWVVYGLFCRSPDGTRHEWMKERIRLGVFMSHDNALFYGLIQNAKDSNKANMYLQTGHIRGSAEK